MLSHEAKQKEKRDEIRKEKPCFLEDVFSESESEVTKKCFFFVFFWTEEDAPSKEVLKLIFCFRHQKFFQRVLVRVSFCFMGLSMLFSIFFPSVLLPFFFQSAENSVLNLEGRIKISHERLTNEHFWNRAFFPLVQFHGEKHGGRERERERDL